MQRLSVPAIKRGVGRGIGKTQRGFTLLEVMVALVLVGVGFTLSLSAMSGSLKLARKATEHENAMFLAKARLDEIVQYPDYTFADQPEVQVYGNTEYSYKIEFRPVPGFDERSNDKVKLPFKLEEISINVYWGKDGEQSYTLTTYKMSNLTQPPPGEIGRAHV